MRNILALVAIALALVIALMTILMSGKGPEPRDRAVQPVAPVGSPVAEQLMLEPRVQVDPCSTPAPAVMPVPTGVRTPDEAFIDEAFSIEWDHVWTGCGGYSIWIIDELIEGDSPGDARYSGMVRMQHVATGAAAELTISPEFCVRNPDGVWITVQSFYGPTTDREPLSDGSEHVFVRLKQRPVPATGR